MDSYRILSLAGGGIRGYLTILLLERLEAERPGFLTHFDLYLGTSTGSIIAFALGHGTILSEIKKLYEKKLRIWKAKFFHNFPGEDCNGRELVCRS